MSGPQVQTRVVGQAPAVSQGAAAGTPHIPVSSDYIRELISQAGRRSQPEHLQYEQIPATPGRLNPSAVAATVPDVQITRLNLHPTVEESPVQAAAPLALADGVDSLEALGTLVRGLDAEQLAALGIDRNELVQAVDQAVQEQTALRS